MVQNGCTPLKLSIHPLYPESITHTTKRQHFLSLLQRKAKEMQSPIEPSRIRCIHYNDLPSSEGSVQCVSYNPATYISYHILLSMLQSIRLILIFRVSFDNQEIRTQTPTPRSLLLSTLTPTPTPSMMIQAQQRPRCLGLQNTQLRLIRTFRSVKRELARIRETVCR